LGLGDWGNEHTEQENAYSDHDLGSMTSVGPIREQWGGNWGAEYCRKLGGPIRGGVKGNK